MDLCREYMWEFPIRYKKRIIPSIAEEYDIQTAEDIQDALKVLLGRTIKEMMEAEMKDILRKKNLSVQIMTITGMVTNVNV